MVGNRASNAANRICRDYFRFALSREVSLNGGEEAHLCGKPVMLGDSVPHARRFTGAR
jgi:hypothetical protein